MSSGITKANIRLKRAYEPPAAEDGLRVLVDRLWPRGIRKAKAAIDCWMKTIAPSAALRQWFNHDVARWDEFQRRYRQELQERTQEVGELRELARYRPITLVFSAHDSAHNDAVVLREFLLHGPEPASVAAAHPPQQEHEHGQAIHGRRHA
jgi:uncharacterized protein YeaO (DUF488 family)